MKKEKNNIIRQSTIKSHISVIQALETYNPRLRVRDIDEKAINGFISFLKGRKHKQGIDESKYTFSRSLIQIRAIIRYISAKGISIKDPFKTNDIIIKPCGRNETYLNEKELSRLIRLMYRRNLSISERRILLMFLFSCSTGIRISDIRALLWRNINLLCKNGVVEFICQKTQRMVHIPLSPMAGDLLCEATEGNIANVENDCNVFVRVYSPTMINATLKCLAFRAGISKDITFHCARRTFATLCREYGVPFYVIQSSLGHKPQNVTERYIQWDTFAADKAAHQLLCFNLDILGKLA